MQINPLLLMLLILVLITVVGRVITWAGNLLGELEKQARERMREAERQRRAMSGQPGAPPPPRNPQEELEHMFALLTGQTPSRRAPPQGGQPARRQPPARPAPPPRPAVRRLTDQEGSSTEGDHGGALAAHHLHSAVEDKHVTHLRPAAPVAPRDTSLSGADAAADNAVSGGAQAAAEGADRITDWIDGLPPLARGVIWSEVLGPPRIKLGPRLGPSARRV